MNVLSRRVRVALGLLGIAVGLVGLLNILAERRAADERRRMLTALAMKPRVSDPSAVVWEGRTYRPNDRVRIAKWAGTFKPSETGARVEVSASAGHAGVVVRGEKRESTPYLRFDPNEPIQIVRVRWLPQEWKASGGGQRLQLPEFEATIHVSHLEPAR